MKGLDAIKGLAPEEAMPRMVDLMRQVLGNCAGPTTSRGLNEMTFPDDSVAMSYPPWRTNQSFADATAVLKVGAPVEFSVINENCETDNEDMFPVISGGLSAMFGGPTYIEHLIVKNISEVSGGSMTTVPIGAIILWSRPLADAPPGFVLADGTKNHPDNGGSGVNLMDSFIKLTDDTPGTTVAAVNTGSVSAGTPGGTISSDTHDHLTVGWDQITAKGPLGYDDVTFYGSHVGDGHPTDRVKTDEDTHNHTFSGDPLSGHAHPPGSPAAKTLIPLERIC